MFWMVGHLKGPTSLYHTPSDCVNGTMAVAEIDGGSVRVHYPWITQDGVQCVPIAYCERESGRPLFNYVNKDSFSHFSPL